MKKTFKFLSLFLVLTIFLVGCEQKDDNSKYLVDINYTTFNDKLDNNEDFILEVVQTGCSNCTSFTPKFESVLGEYKITAYSINLTDMTDENRQEFLDKYNVSGTPTVLFFKGGKETSTLKRLTGNQSEDKIVSKLKANGYISE